MSRLETKLKNVQIEMLNLLDKRENIEGYRIRFYSLMHEQRRLQERYVKCTGHEWTPTAQGVRHYA